jgi:hypothetical protein
MVTKRVFTLSVVTMAGLVSYMYFTLFLRRSEVLNMGITFASILCVYGNQFKNEL